MARFTKRPVTIDAVLFRGCTDVGGRPVFSDPTTTGPVAKWVLTALAKQPEEEGALMPSMSGTLFIMTLEGMETARPGDWIIRGIKGEIYPCKPDIFEATYIAAED